MAQPIKLRMSTVSGLTDKFADLDSILANLQGDETVDGSIKNIAKQYIDNLINGAPEAYDTLKEIADLLATDENNIATILAEIANVKADETEYTDFKKVGDELRALQDIADGAGTTGIYAITIIDEAVNPADDSHASAWAVIEGKVLDDPAKVLDSGLSKLVYTDNSYEQYPVDLVADTDNNSTEVTFIGLDTIPSETFSITFTYFDGPVTSITVDTNVGDDFE